MVKARMVEILIMPLCCQWYIFSCSQRGLAALQREVQWIDSYSGLFRKKSRHQEEVPAIFFLQPTLREMQHEWHADTCQRSLKLKALDPTHLSTSALQVCCFWFGPCKDGNARCGSGEILDPCQPALCRTWATTFLPLAPEISWGHQNASNIITVIYRIFKYQNRSNLWNILKL